MNLFHEIFAAIWFFLPAGIANAAPVIAQHVPFLKNLNQPLDFGKSWKGARILGDHKTFRGLIIGIIFGFLVAGFQAWSFNLASLSSDNGPSCVSTDNHYFSCPVFSIMAIPTPISIIHDLSWIDFNEINWVAFGVLSGAGALLGDATKSFFKRRQNLKPGATWFPFDQIDYIIGGILFTLPIVQLAWWQYLLVIIVWLIIHPISTISGYLMKLKDSPL